MNLRLVLGLGLIALALAAAFGAVRILRLPPTPVASAPPPIAEAEAAATLAALKPPKRPRPLVAIVGINDATETTDYLMPYGILRRADVADVVALATGPGPVTLYPALTVEPTATIAEFDARQPEGADYVIVPAMSRDDDPTALAWIRGQAAKGAVIVGVCAGAKIVGEAGLLDGRRATTHWYYLDELRGRHPAMTYVADRRLVVDRGVATTTGISASMPVSLILIEAIAGREKAEAVAQGLGLTDWDARHVSAAFTVTRPFALTVMRNTLAFWNRERPGIELSSGIDEVSLALVADAWSRTYRSRAVTFAGAADALVTRNGLRVRPDQVTPHASPEPRLPAIGDRPPAQGTGRCPAGHRGALWRRHRRHRRHAARISQAGSGALTRSTTACIIMAVGAARSRGGFQRNSSWRIDRERAVAAGRAGSRARPRPVSSAPAERSIDRSCALETAEQDTSDKQVDGQARSR